MAALAFASCGEKENPEKDFNDFIEKHKNDSTVVNKSTFRYYLYNGTDFKIRCEKIGAVPKVGDCNVAQGAVGNGNYAYFALKTSDDSKSVIVKYTLSPFALVAQSKEFNGQHSNDLAYFEDMIIVSHSSKDLLTSIDASTLEVKEEAFSCGINNSAITYNADRDRFAFTGGAVINVATRDFTLENKYNRTDKTGYTTQGMGSDKDYLYFPMSTKGGGKMIIYDWEGNLKKIVEIPLTEEVETMFVIGDAYYLSCFANKGAVLYRIYPEQAR